MDMRLVRAIALKDVKEVLGSKQLLLPMVLVPLILIIVLPTVAVLVPSMTKVPVTTLGSMETFMERLPPSMKELVKGLDDKQKFIYLMAVFFFAPFFLIIPLMVASIIGASSFAGEKERKTLESLLYTPVTDAELMLGKTLSAFVPSVAVTWASFIVYTLVVNALGYPAFGRVFFPNLTWLVLMIWVVPSMSFFGLGVIVLVSSKAKGSQEAQQIGGMVVVPVLLLVFLQVFGVVYLSLSFALLLGLAFLVIDYFLIRLGARAFVREDIITKLK
jgi:ABC-type Na+ efflux pump permease subunit